jgi:FAD/FMN-containing dehydrogenase
VHGPAAAVELLARFNDALGERVTAFELIARPPLELVLAHAVPGMRDPLAAPHPWVVLLDVSEVAPSFDPRPAVEAVLESAMEAGLVADAAMAESDAQAAAFWHLREHVPEAQRLEGLSLKNDISVAVSRIPEFVAAADAELAALVPGIRVMCFGHVGDGNLHYNQSKPIGMSDEDFRAVAPAIHGAVHAVTAALGGSISAEHGIGRLKQQAFLHAKPAVAVATMQRIKAALDPHGLFNPGRVLPRPIRQDPT